MTNLGELLLKWAEFLVRKLFEAKAVTKLALCFWLFVAGCGFLTLAGVTNVWFGLIGFTLVGLSLDVFKGFVDRNKELEDMLVRKVKDGTEVPVKRAFADKENLPEDTE